MFDLQTQKPFIYVIMTEEIQAATTSQDTNKSVSNPDFDIIASQTGVDDLLVIERTFMECSNDITKTILKLLNMLPKETAPKEPSDIDVFRAILDEKDKIYHDIMTRNKQ